jgi:Flp pilus assembly protein TadG
MMRKACTARRGAATVELALLLPFLLFLFIIAVDWARVFYYTQVVENCARNGAIYSSDLYSITQSPYPDLTTAAVADAQGLTPQPTVTSSSGSDSYGNYVSCTVSYSFQTLTNFPGVPQSTPIVCTVKVYQAQQLPN